MNLSPGEMSALESVENRSKMIFDRPIRERLKKLGLIETVPSLRRYREVPYRATSKGHAVIRAYQERERANCQTPPPAEKEVVNEKP